MKEVRITIQDEELRNLLIKCKNKKIYRDLANEVLQDLKEEIARVTHVDTGEMQASWETTPLKMRDSNYAVFGEIINEAQKPWHKQPYPSYELARGGDHDAVAIGVSIVEGRLGDTVKKTLEGLLR